MKSNTLKKIKRKTLLYKSGVEYADYGLNHVEGCSHGCRYPCYAMMLKKRTGQVKTYDEWIQPKIVGNALELLEKEIPKLKEKINRVFMCFATDPFMYRQKEVIDLSLKIIERLNRDGIKVVTISKGIYPKELTDTKRYGASNEYGSTIVSLSENFRKNVEPGAAMAKERIKSLKRLHESGLKTWVSIEPYPTPNIIEQNIEDVLRQVSFVDEIVFGKWNYNKIVGFFDQHRSFYNREALKVLDFCRRRNIKRHIKDGTLNSEQLGCDYKDYPCSLKRIADNLAL
jgi:DNA repair photolyase